MEDLAGLPISSTAAPGTVAASHSAPRYDLCYRPFGLGRGFAFPCDAAGNVVLDDLSERALKNYLYARIATGSELAWPSIERRF